MKAPELESAPTVEHLLREHVDAGALAGVATLVWRQGRVVDVTTVGCRDLTANLPVERDTIFRIASMTKPVTAVAALMLFDEGRFALDEPITRIAPEFAQLRVLRDPEGPLDQTDASQRPITFGDLLTHRSGLTYAELHSGPIGRAYADALGGQIDNVLRPDEWIARLATLPLIDPPGAGFHYGHSSDLLGFLISRLDHAPLGAVLDRRIFTPLGMRDTGFVVASHKRARCAGLCGFDDNGTLISLKASPGGHALAERPGEMSFESGGQGLWSTLDDYLIFARVLLGGGAVDGVRLLRPETCAMMTANQLTPGQRATAQLLGRRLFAEGHGYGMGVAVVMEPDKADPLTCRGGAGTVGWPGAFSGWWQADPRNESILIFLTHNMPELHQMATGVGLAAWGAIADFRDFAYRTPVS
jgi:CubicO group peptidase (beta-lactamase class C family)